MKKIFILFALVVGLTAPLFAAGQSEGKESPKKVVYWSMWNEAEPQGLVIAEAVEAFTDETGIEVEIVFNGREIRKTLQPALDAGETIDLFEEDIERVGNTWGNYLLNLEDFANQVYPSTNGQPFKTQINQTLVDVVTEIGGGAMHEVPYQPSMFVVMYNKDLFNKAGIKSSPTTLKELEDAFAKLKAIGITGITVDDAYMAAFFGYNMSRIIGMEKTVEMADNDDFSDPGVLRFAQIWSDFAKKGYISQKAASNIFPSGQIEELAKGTVAMYLNGTWLPNEIRGNNPNMNWGSFAYPAIDPAGEPLTSNNYGAQCLAINKDSKVAQEAFQLIVWLTTGEWDVKLSEGTMGVPVGNDSVWPVQLAEAKEVLDNTKKRMPWAVGMENSSQVNAKIKENFAKLVVGQITPQQFYDNMNR